MTPAFACVILTQGQRPDELARAVGSVVRQRGVDTDVLVVVNGGDLVAAPVGARVHRLEHNVGIPAARNLGVANTTAEYVAFLDDDAWLPDDDTFANAAGMLADAPRLGILTLRLIDPDGRAPQRRHVPRLRAGDPGRSSAVTTFLGGACIIRRAVFERAGLFPDDFFYAHEELSLAWRAIEAGYGIRYEAGLRVLHPSLPASRHPRFHYLNARNRVLLARRHLPWPLGVVYVALWAVLSAARSGGPAGLRQVLAGFADGLVHPRGRREPVSWAAVARMTAAGRPPII